MPSPAPYVVQADTWLGAPYAEGSSLVLAGTVVELVPGSAEFARYGGAGNLQPLPANQTGDDADHAALDN